MRLSSHHHLASPQRQKRCWMGSMMCRKIVATSLFAFLSFLSSLHAQPPGTFPPKSVFEQTDDSDLSALPLRAFLFRSESGNPVMMPGMTWERLERLLDLDDGLNAARQSFTYQSLGIEGSVNGNRAELDVLIRMTLEPTEGRWVTIPLGMQNFHRLAPPDVSGVDEYYMTLAPDDSGYLLLVKGDQQREVTLKMHASARVDTFSSAQSLEFRLPNVPSTVELTVDAIDVIGEVFGRGDEATSQKRLAGGKTEFTVESGGSTFSLRWGQQKVAGENLPLWEVDSRIVVQWDTPQAQPIATVRQSIRSLRGSIDSFPLRLPKDSRILDDPPRMSSNGLAINWGATTTDSVGEIREVIIPDDEREPRIDLNYDLRLPNENADSTSPLGFRVPEVVGALRHRGTIEIRTGGDYRLRWRSHPQPWVRSEIGDIDSESVAGRTYRFRFDRADFELPMWLGEKERQLRMVSQSEITINESIASLDMTVQVIGRTLDGRLYFDDADWPLTLIEDLETGESLEPSFTEDGNREIEFNVTGRDDPAPIRIRAELALPSGDESVSLQLPRILQSNDEALVHSSTVDIINSGREMLVVDLEASSGLTRIPSSFVDGDSRMNRFRIVSQDSAAVVVGTIIDQLPRITLSGESTIELDSQRIRTTVDWMISSTLDLEGRLPIRIPKVAAVKEPRSTTNFFGTNSETSLFDADSDSSASRDSASSERLSTIERWDVKVDDVQAKLTWVSGDRYELSSPNLASGSMKIRWIHDQEIRSASTDGAIESVALPRPDVADVTVRGAIRVALQGTQQVGIAPADSPGVTDLELASLPREPIRLKLQSKLSSREELTIRQPILRTAIGRSTRHEQVLAVVQGGDQFRVGLPADLREVRVEALIDNEARRVRREGMDLVVALPGDKASHVVDLRVWVTAPISMSFTTIEPMLKLPIGIGRVYWQIVAPLDGHAVWASPTLGRSMSWRFDRWKLFRDPSHTDETLVDLVGSKPNLLPPGNRYLYVGSDLHSFQVTVVSRVVLWVIIGTAVLLVSLVLTYIPRTRHPLTAVVGAVLFGGLLAIAPDAAVLAGQFGIIGLVLVIVMMAIRVLVAPNRNDRVFQSSRSAPKLQTQSTSSQHQPNSGDQRGVASTQAMSPPSPTEVRS